MEKVSKLDAKCACLKKKDAQKLFDFSPYCLFPEPEVPKIKLTIIGVRQAYCFQRAKFFAGKLYEHLKKQFAEPIFREMNVFDWDIYLTEMKRKYGGQFWGIEKPVAVFINDSYIGNDRDMDDIMSPYYEFEPRDVDFDKLGEQAVLDYMLHTVDVKKRKFAYISISYDSEPLGTFLILLYCDLVPLTCDVFLRKCIEGDFKNTKILRVARPGWIQCGSGGIPSEYLAPENYSVPHDRRGVVCMVNSEFRKDNTSQFCICLEAAPWMDCKNVAFGQVVEGKHVLDKMEKVNTYYQTALDRIEITDCGEYNVCPIPFTDEINRPECVPFKETLEDDSQTMVDVCTKYDEGKYALATDVASIGGSGMLMKIQFVDESLVLNASSGYLQNESQDKV